MKPVDLVGYIDSNGEVHDGVKSYLCGDKIVSPFGDLWMQTNQAFLIEFAARRDVTGEVFRVFLYLNGRLDFQNIIRVPQVEIAKDLSLTRQSVNRAIKKLETMGILLRGAKVGQTVSWRLNPNAGWKGKVVDLREAQKTHLQLIVS